MCVFGLCYIRVSLPEGFNCYVRNESCVSFLQLFVGVFLFDYVKLIIQL